MAHELAVWLSGEPVGTLSLAQGRLCFQYAPAWLARADALPLSCSLPLQAAPFDDHQARPFFAGLLPEGTQRRLVAQQLQVSRQNDFALLDGIGGECAGAVALLAPGQTLPRPEDGDDVQWLCEEEVLALLDELPLRPMLAGREGLRLSLAGAQEKLPVMFDGARIGLPRNGTPSSHILKPAIRTLADTVNNEGFCLALAEAMQFQPVRAQVRTVQGRAFLLVERYDRRARAGELRQRLHQEDFCQALGIVPEMKYQNEGGPGWAQCFDLLRRSTRPSAPQVLRLFDYVIFTALIGNHDAHAKNFSLLYTENGAVLAPLYDVVSTAVYPHLTPKMAMKIGGKYKFDDVRARHWERFAEATGMGKAQARKRILTVAKALPTCARAVLSDPTLGFADCEIAAQIVRLIEQRCALTTQRLTTAAT